MKRILLASAAVLGLSLATPALAAHGDHHGQGSSGDNAAPITPPSGSDAGSGHHGGGSGSGGERSWHHHDNNGSNGGNPLAGTGGSNGSGDHGWHHHDNGSNAAGAGSNAAGAGSNAAGANPFAGTGGSHHRGGDSNNWSAGGNGGNRDHDGSRWNAGRGDHNGRGDRGRGRHGDWGGFNRAFNAPHRYHWGSYHRPHGWYYQRWELGAFLPGLFWDRQYWIDDYNDFDLSDPPEGTVWVRYGDDALLIDEDSGEVIQVVYGIFY